MTDLFTKWVVAYPLKDKSGASVARAIVDMIYTYGPPVKIITDQGREFINEVNDTCYWQHIATGKSKSADHYIAVANTKSIVHTSYFDP